MQKYYWNKKNSNDQHYSHIFFHSANDNLDVLNYKIILISKYRIYQHNFSYLHEIVPFQIIQIYRPDKLFCPYLCISKCLYIAFSCIVTSLTLGSGLGNQVCTDAFTTSHVSNVDIDVDDVFRSSSVSLRHSSLTAMTVND